METTTGNPLTVTPVTTRVVVSNYLCMGITIAVLGVRAWKCMTWRRRFGLDDIALLLALIAGIVESALVEYAVRSGLGAFIRSGNSSRLQNVSELMYASDLFFLAAMFFAKLAVVRLVYRVASARAIAKGKLMILQVSIVIWVAFSIPAIAFQCGMPHPWLYVPERCVGAGSLWYPTLIFNILTDAWLATCVWTALPDMSVSSKERQVMLGFFSSRFLVCILCVVQLAMLVPALKSEASLQVLPNPTVLKQIVMNASILSAGLPVLYRSLATYVKPNSATIDAVITNDKTTPLDDIRQPAPSVVTNGQTGQSLSKETSVVDNSAPTLGNEDFSTRFSVAFHKEISSDDKV